MNITLDTQSAAAVSADAVIMLAFEDGPAGHHPAIVAELFASKEFAGKSLEPVLLYQVEGLASRRLLLIGAGKTAAFDSAAMRRVAGTAVRVLKSKGVKTVALHLDESFAGPEFISAAAEGAITGDYEPDNLKSEPNGKKIEALSLLVPAVSPNETEALRRGTILGEAQNFTRVLVNEPANRLGPLDLAARAQAMAQESGLECEILDKDRMTQLGMGALLGVALGSAKPPALIVLRYQPAESPAGGSAHLGLVGKGVTFDSGGLSIKPADGMEKMKYDMAGGAAVIGAMRAIAALKPAIPVTALIPTVENMTGDNAQRPGDIVTSLSGKTIEVLNTDAEGRLILADALTYAQRIGCTHLVDAATLTGAIVVALGHIHVGLFSNNDEFREKVQAAARGAGERMWPMPLDEDYKDYLKSAFADLPNIGGRWGGAVTAAMFLREFANPLPWVHLDIAGTAWLDDARPFLAKGSTGIGVRTFVNLALNL